jgi:hypothetical protein
MSTTRKKVSSILGKKFNRLTVTEYLGKGDYAKHYWLCKCECGKTIRLNTSRITSNNPTKSCGCLRKEVLLGNRCDPTRHGLHKHKLYSVFYAMHYRCYNKNAPRFKYYGGKGVKVCEEWANFVDFYSWAVTSGYKEGLSIDRINPDSDYMPSNCRWITVSENTRRINRARKP